ncbi:TetR/AcrR family transcriptional regulator [Umezawaea tangerina]|uniref:TetR family transcriptional regulator n=1 Tax=Umezawaea tangerina TaxID=84725 RepID=A0A2T0T7A6_9PSEU|nr:TetR/AcrR family transcriptional regulator [Umezawaea tangerina]PRY41559.1 TetR family transcriptional regulator [Umezawaea tangerina]
MATSDTSKPLRGAQARQAVLDAAGDAFLADGLRKTSIESIARAAGVSRPTVYAHFADKEDIFRTIVAKLHDEQFTAMRAATTSDGPVAGRLHAALLARFAPFVALTSSSEHGAELLDENSRVCGDITRASRTRSLRVLEQVLKDGERDGELDLAALDLTAAQAARVVYDAARGAKEDASVTPAAFRRSLQRLVDVLLRGLAR